MHDILRRICELQPSYSPNNTPEMQERGRLVRQELKDAVDSLQTKLAVQLGPYGRDFGVDASDGIGRKTEAPWVRFHSKVMSPAPTDGYYVVIHFKRDGTGVYFTLGCGSTVWNGKSLNRLKPEKLAEKTMMAKKAVVDIHGDVRLYEDQIDLGAKANLPRTFEQATALARFIPASDLNDHNLEEVLSQLATYLKTVYDAQSLGFDMSQADQAIEDIERVLSPRRKRTVSQGYGLNAAEKRAVELRAMDLVKAWLHDHGYATKDTSKNKPYDFLAEKDNKELFVEVKGTTSSNPSAVLMTANEVDLHQTRKGETALAIVSSIKLIRDAEPKASGGIVDMMIGWDIDQWSLTPTAYKVENV